MMILLAAALFSAPSTHLPLLFVENRGQLDERAKYFAWDREMHAFLTADGFALRLAPRLPPEEGPAGVDLHLRFEGASDSVRLEGVDPRATRTSFFLGSDPAGWRTNVPAFGGVRYRDLYPGIDLAVGERDARLVYDLLLSRGADLDRVVVRLEGADALRIGEDGALLAETPLGPLRQAKPRTFVVSPDGERREIESRFRLVDGGRFGFEAPDRDPEGGLLVDPGLEYATFLDASGMLGLDSANAMALDASGNAYVTDDDRIAKLNATGTAAVFVSTLAGGRGIALDAAGAIYLTGATGLGFPATPGAYDTTWNGDLDVFVAKLDPSAGAFVYATFLGGASDDYGNAIEVDASGNAFLTGFTESGGFPATPGAFDTTLNASDDAFVAKLDPTGSSLLYSTFLGGAPTSFPMIFGGHDEGFDIEIDASGAAYVTGNTFTPLFPTTPGAFDTTFGGTGGDDWLAKLDPTGSSLVYSTFLGGSSAEQGPGPALALDLSGAAYVRGWTASADFPTTAGAFDTTFNGGVRDVFVVKVDPTGASLAYGTFLGGSGNDGWASANFGLGPLGTIAVTGAGAAVLTGRTASTNFPTTVGAYDTSFNGGEFDAFLAKLSPSGSALWYSTYLGGSEADVGTAVALDAADAATVAGTTKSSNFPVTPGSYDPTFPPFFGAITGFVAKLDLLPAGAAAYGASTPGCAGPLAIGVTSIPKVGNGAFAVTASNAPASAAGILALAGGALGAPLSVLGASVWIDPAAPPLVLLSATSGANGAVEFPLPLPANPSLAGGSAFLQFFFADACAPGLLSATNALGVTVQP